MMKTKKIFTIGIVSILIIVGCKKSDFLNTIPSSNLVIPSNLTDFQALIDHYSTMSETPALAETSADNYYISSYPTFQAGLQPKDQNTYIWAADIFAGKGGDADWNEMYENVLYSNVILDGLSSIPRTSSNATTWDYVKGQALFTRAYQFYNLSQIFAPVYDASSANSDLGIPLRLTSDINPKTTRSSVAQTYNQIINDLTLAASLLPAAVPAIYLNRPSKPAAFAALARTYLSMRNYAQAQLYADSCLQLYNTLLDYNTLPATTTTTPFTGKIQEAFYQSNIYSAEQVLYHLRFQTAGYSVDTALYRSYSSNDLRSFYYFVNPVSTTTIFTKQGYTPAGLTTPIFSGFATDEMYLIRAEGEARAGNTTAAMNDLNTLLVKRWKTGTFIPFTAANSQQALNTILTERRKELLLRGTRWTDLRRLNKEGANITLTRVLNGITYTLAPNSPNYTLPIPPDVISLTGIQQNVRQ